MLSQNETDRIRSESHSPCTGSNRHTAHINYLDTLQAQANATAIDDYYLWPNTPRNVQDHQDKIYERVGVPDYDVRNRRSRPASILRFIHLLQKRGFLNEEFSVLDVACGDAVVLWQIKRSFESANCYGMDCDHDSFGTYPQIREAGVLLFCGYLQHLVQSSPPEAFDLVLMLNTYRGWKSAQLSTEDADLPVLVDDWLEKEARFAIVTATKTQIKTLKQKGHNVMKLGKGEDDSTMICFSKQKLPCRYW